MLHKYPPCCMVVSWVVADVKPIIKLYNWCMKELLGVSSITMWCDRRDMNNGPLSFAIKYVSNLNTPLGKPVTYIDKQ